MKPSRPRATKPRGDDRDTDPKAGGLIQEGEAGSKNEGSGDGTGNGEAKS